MSYWEVFGVLTVVRVDVSIFSESEQEWSRSLKNVAPLISAVNMVEWEVTRQSLVRVTLSLYLDFLLM